MNPEKELRPRFHSFFCFVHDKSDLQFPECRLFSRVIYKYIIYTPLCNSPTNPVCKLSYVNPHAPGDGSRPGGYGKGSRFRDSLLLHSPSVPEQPQLPAGKGCHTQTQHVACTRFAFCSHHQQEPHCQQHDIESTLHKTYFYLIIA